MLKAVDIEVINKDNWCSGRHRGHLFLYPRGVLDDSYNREPSGDNKGVLPTEGELSSVPVFKTRLRRAIEEKYSD
jgi:hypothetical protein